MGLHHIYIVYQIKLDLPDLSEQTEELEKIMEQSELEKDFENELREKSRAELLEVVEDSEDLNSEDQPTEGKKGGESE